MNRTLGASEQVELSRRGHSDSKLMDTKWNLWLRDPTGDEAQVNANGHLTWRGTIKALLTTGLAC